MMQEPSSHRNGMSTLRLWITWAAVIGTTLWAGYFFVFLIYQSIAGGAVSTNWFLRMIQEHPAATIGIAMSAITAFCLVALLEIARGPVEFEAMGFKFKGASGPVVLWVFCFLAMIFGVWLLWEKTGPGAAANITTPSNYVEKPLQGPESAVIAALWVSQWRSFRDSSSRSRC